MNYGFRGLIEPKKNSKKELQKLFCNDRLIVFVVADESSDLVIHTVSTTFECVNRAKEYIMVKVEFYRSC